VVFDGPPDPIRPTEPVRVARDRPFTVTVAVAVLYGSGAVGLVAALALLAGAGHVVDDLRERAVELGVEPVVAVDVSTAVRTALLSSGAGALALAMLSLSLGWGVLRRSEAARVGALVVAVASLGCGLVRTSVTAFGSGVDWSVASGNGDPMLTGRVGQAFGEAMPGWLVGLGGGLTDLQSLGYIAVTVLLIVPVSREYFRSRMAWYATEPGQ
jgi:hypothetical protein